MKVYLKFSFEEPLSHTLALSVAPVLPTTYLTFPSLPPNHPHPTSLLHLQPCRFIFFSFPILIK